MSTEFITDKVLTASQFVECLTGNYYTRCDTVKEAQNCIRLAGKSYNLARNSYPLTKIKSGNNAFVLVYFSTETNYTEYIYKAVTIPDTDIDAFKERLADL